MALEGDFNGSPVISGSYMMASSGSGLMIQPNGKNSTTRNINADSMSIMDEALFELLPLYSTAETSWYSSSSEDMETFYPLDRCNISNGHSHPQSLIVANNIISAPQSSMLYRQSAFDSYLRPNTHSVYVKNGRENLMKRCFKFLRKIEAQKLNQAANIQEQHEFDVSLQNKAAFHHMIAERNRRGKLKHHFSLLHSLLPYNSKRDKYSVLANTFKYMSELKLRVDELEQRNHALEESLRINISKKEGSTSFDLRLEENQATLLYSSDEVVLEQSKEIPNHVDMRINVRIDPLSSPTSLMIVLLERLRELQLELVSVQSNVQPFKLEVRLLITVIKGDLLESSRWENVVQVVRRTFSVNE